MARDLNPKCKQCRRIGEKLFLKGERCQTGKCALVKKNYPPGLHGQKGRKKPSDYGAQLNEKQKTKKMYRILENDIRLVLKRAQNKKGNSSENLLKLLEMRLDNAVFRLGLASSRDQARQIVNHGLVLVNGKKAGIPSYRLKDGDLIVLKDRLKRGKYFQAQKEKMKKNILPSWLYLDLEKTEGKVLHEPKTEDLEKIGVNAQMIVEYYSR